jgi:hypothetical protein
MRMVDAIVAYDAEQLWAEVTLTESSTFMRKQGVRACVGLEYLAQASAAFFTLQATEDTAPKQGMLIACRRFESSQSYYRLDSHLLLHVSLTSAVPPDSHRSALVKFRGEIYLADPSMPALTTIPELSGLSTKTALTVADLSVYL